MRVVTPSQMQQLEQRFMREQGVESFELMARAADGLADAAVRLLGRANWPPQDAGVPLDLPKLTGMSAVVCCGPGANGGDGWALAWRLYDMNCEVLALTHGTPTPGSAAHRNYLECAASWRSIRIIDLAGAQLGDPEDGQALIEYLTGLCGTAMLRAQLCVDALFGTGLSRPLSGVYLGMSRLMALIAESGARVLAVDIPSGLDGATGADTGACPADMTVTFQHLKRGQLFVSGQDVCGELICHDIGIPDAYAPADAPEYLRPADVRMPLRRHDSHKGTYGHLLTVAGSHDYAGAALLCVTSALRAGAGLVTAGCVAELRPLLQLSAPSAMALKLCDADVFDNSAVERARDALPGKTALAIGPGMTRRTAPELLALLLSSGLPAVVDADALNLIALNPDLRALLGPRHVLTPHPGEMARLLGRAVADPAADAHALAAECGCVVLLKGCATCISDGTRDYMMNPGVPGMACGGSGDVLTGVIGALLAQGIEPLRAAAWGALLHGRAGARAQSRLGEVSMNASDIVTELPGAFMESMAAARR